VRKALPTPPCTRGALLVARDERGQSTVEAALLVPALLLCLGLLVQPLCLLYTRAVMQAAAAECCRLVATRPVLYTAGDGDYEAFALRRLAAVPNVGVFHRGGGDGWDVTITASPSSHTVRTRIQTTVDPLPFWDGMAALLNMDDGEGHIRLVVDVTETVRSSWVDGDYRDWSELWD
jgi:Flp pilus assembly protein TadG